MLNSYSNTTAYQELKNHYETDLSNVSLKDLFLNDENNRFNGLSFICNDFLPTSLFLLIERRLKNLIRLHWSTLLTNRT